MITAKNRRFGITHNRTGERLQRLLSRPCHDPLYSPEYAATPFQRKVVATMKAVKGARFDRIGVTGSAIGVDKTQLE